MRGLSYKSNSCILWEKDGKLNLTTKLSARFIVLVWVTRRFGCGITILSCIVRDVVIYVMIKNLDLHKLQLAFINNQYPPILNAIKEISSKFYNTDVNRNYNDTIIIITGFFYAMHM